MQTIDEMQKRLSELCLQDYNGYLNAERPEAIAELRSQLVRELEFSEQMLPQLEEEYRRLVKSDDTERRMEVASRKSDLSRRLEEVARLLEDKEAMRVLARRQYSKTKELQDSLAEQFQLRVAVWGKK